MSAKHTPGPWSLNKGFREPVIGIDAKDGGDLLPIVPTVEGYNTAQARANARLIAAAPDMLAVLMKLRRGDLHQRVRPLYDEAQAAIAKATGGAS